MLKKRKNTRPDIDRTDVVFANNATTSFLVVGPFVDNKGVKYKNAVLLDTEFFDGISTRNWGRKLREYVADRTKNNPVIMSILDEKGNEQQLQFARLNERVEKQNGASHKVINKLSSSNDNISKLAVIHIDEIVSVSEENNPYYTNEHSHKWLDENGWLHRNANVINNRTGDIYNITLDIAKTKDGRTILYATNGKIKKVGNANVNSLIDSGSRPNSNFENSISQADNDVNIKLSLQETAAAGETRDQLIRFLIENSTDSQKNLCCAFYSAKPLLKVIVLSISTDVLSTVEPATVKLVRFIVTV